MTYNLYKYLLILLLAPMTHLCHAQQTTTDDILRAIEGLKAPSPPTTQNTNRYDRLEARLDELQQRIDVLNNKRIVEAEVIKQIRNTRAIAGGVAGTSGEISGEAQCPPGQLWGNPREILMGIPMEVRMGLWW